MSKQSKTLIMSLIITLLALTLLIGGTFALFSDKVTVNNHLAAGSVDVGFEQISYQEYSHKGEGGLLKLTTNDTVIDLTKNGSSVFNIVSAAPGNWFCAQLKVSNIGTIAFDYSVKILWDNKLQDDTMLALADQIKIEILNEEMTSINSFLLSSCNEVESITNVGRVLTNGSQTFYVKAEFLSLDDNNQVQGKAINFDLELNAVQVTE